MIQVLSPLGRPPSEGIAQTATRLSSTNGARIALLDNRKLNAGTLLKAVGACIQDEYENVTIHYWDKGQIGATGPAPSEMVNAILSSADAALVALGD